MDRPAEGPSGPRVSVIMSNYRGGRYLAAAIESVLAQSLNELELIVVDDCSGDDGPAIVESYRQRDDRIRLIVLDANLGPAGARNRGIEAARGAWLAVVDNDDVIHPERLRILLDAAERDDADIVADDLLTFYEDSPRISTMLPESSAEPFWVALSDFVRSNAIYGQVPPLGYCKPLIRRRALGATRYDESLRIGEDAHLLARLLAAGLRFRIYPWLLYFYRKHSRSISFRFSQADSERLIATEQALLRAHAALGPDIVAAHEATLASLERAAAFAILIDGLKKRSLIQIARAIRAEPGALRLLRLPLRAFVERRIPRGDPNRETTPSLLVLRESSGQPSGSQAASHCQSVVSLLLNHGYSVRTELLDLADPNSCLLRREDCLRVARHSRVAGNVLLAQPLLAARCLPYMLGADCLMLEPTSAGFLSRRRGEAGLETTSVSVSAPVLIGPIAAAPDPGQDGHVAITAADNAADIAGLRWFVVEVWPRVREVCPDSSLRLAGASNESTTPLPPGVSRVGAGMDLLTTAAVVVFPRKILSEEHPRVLEALRRGKAVVATSATRDGLPEALHGTLHVADAASAMAERVANLLTSRAHRTELASTALASLKSVGAGRREENSLVDIITAMLPPRLPAEASRKVLSTVNGSAGPIEKRL